MINLFRRMSAGGAEEENPGILIDPEDQNIIDELKAVLSECEKQVNTADLRTDFIASTVDNASFNADAPSQAGKLAKLLATDLVVYSEKLSQDFIYKAGKALQRSQSLWIRSRNADVIQSNLSRLQENLILRFNPEQACDHS